MKCWRYSAKKSAENWSTEMATISLGGGRCWAAAKLAAKGSASKAAKYPSFILLPCSVATTYTSDAPAQAPQSAYPPPSSRRKPGSQRVKNWVRCTSLRSRLSPG